jgi:glyoxylase-like metal-dependent hydrolase (beta-lactamase superfamily II)
MASRWRPSLPVDTGTTLSEAAAIDSDVSVIVGRPVTHIVLTHRHFDHIPGSSAFVCAEIHCALEVADYMSSAAATQPPT